MTQETVRLLDQLTVLESTSLGRLEAFKAAQAIVVAKTQGLAPGEFPPGTVYPMLQQLEIEVTDEGAIHGDLVNYIQALKNWLINDPTYSALGIQGPAAPKIPAAVVNYFASISAILVPGSPGNLASLPLATPPITVKPGAPVGSNSPWGFI